MTLKNLRSDAHFLGDYLVILAIMNVMRRTLDLKRTEAFLLEQEGVLDASVWLRGDRLQAHITPAPHFAVCSSALREACAEQLGEAQAPESILIVPR